MALLNRWHYHWYMNKGIGSEWNGTEDVPVPTKEHISFDATSSLSGKNVTSIQGHWYDNGQTFAGEVLGGKDRTFMDENGQPFTARSIFVGVFNADR